MRNGYIFASLAGLALIAVLFSPAPPAQAQGGLRGSGGRGAAHYVCKSGQNVKNPRACKENGGHK